MTFRKHFWLVIPLAAALGCAGSQPAQQPGQSLTNVDGKPSQKPTQAGTKAEGKATLVDEGPASASGQGAAAGAVAAGQGAPAQLVPYQGANGYTVLMPPNPQQNDRTQDTPGGPVQVHIAQVQDSSGKYISSLSEFPKGSLDKVKSKDLLDSLQQATVQSMGGTLVNSQDVEAGGLQGREFTATDPGGSEVTARVFVGGSNVYTLAGTYPKGQMPGSVQQFLGSFQPPAGTAVGGSGASDTATDRTATGDSVSAGGSQGSVTTAPAEPAKKSKKRARSNSTGVTTSESSSSSGSGSR